MKKLIKQNKDLINIEGKEYKKEAFMLEEFHPAVGRILVFDGIKFKILDDRCEGPHRTGTFIRKVTEDDEEHMKEYDRDLEELSLKLAGRVDIKRLIKENIKEKPMQELKTGLFILKAMENGEEVDEEHHKGCYNYKIHYKNQMFEFMSGRDVINNIII